MRSIYIGFDTRQADAFAVCRHSIQRRLNQPIQTHGIVLSQMRALGLYDRPHERRGNVMWDTISDAPCSTEFSNTRFLTPKLAGSGYSLFLDSDMVCRVDMANLFDLCAGDPSKAVWCVKHNHTPKDGSAKMDGQIQTAYGRKNWSSFMMFNCDHPANRKLTMADINSLPGRDLHRLHWLEDREIGELHPEWNYLVGTTKLDTPPKVVHFTEGTPAMEGYEDSQYADLWWKELWSWAG